MKKVLFFISVYSFSLLATMVTPLAEDRNGNSILGCFNSTIDKKGEEKTLVMRNNGEFDEIMFTRNVNKNVVFAITGVKKTDEKGLSLNWLSEEGTNLLKNRGNEAWTFETSKDTFFTARGNFIGFFLQNSSTDLAEAQLVLGLLKNRIINLNCTNDEKVMKNWIQEISKYKPY